MNKYHISPATGNPNICRAVKTQCPLGDNLPHFDSKEEARNHYEKTQSSLPISSTKKFAKTAGETTHVFHEALLDKAVKNIEKANRRLARAGITESFTYTTEHFMEESKNRLSNGSHTMTPRIRMVIDSPAIGFKDYKFVAAIEKAEKGFVVKTAKGEDVPAPENLKCDHCGRAVDRQKTYIVEDAEGARKQLGSECVKAYLGGVKPEGLWALTFDPNENINDDEEEFLNSRGYNDPIRQARPTEEMIAYGLAVSNGGENFKSRAYADDYGTTSTSSEVETALFTSDGEYAQEIQEKAQSYIDSGEAKKVLESFRNADETTSFGRNLKVIASGEYVRGAHMGILLGGLSGIAREKRKLAKEAKRAEDEKAGIAEWGVPTPGFTSFVGDTMKGRGMRVKEVKPIAGTDYHGRDIMKSGVIMRDSENHEVVWWASKEIDVKEGDELFISSGKIAHHKTYQGTDQTLVSNIRFKVVSGPSKDEVEKDQDASE